MPSAFVVNSTQSKPGQSGVISSGRDLQAILFIWGHARVKKAELVAGLRLQRGDGVKHGRSKKRCISVQKLNYNSGDKCLVPYQ
jgi:hypothetical protein